MARAFLAALLVLSFAAAAHAQGGPQLSLIRAVRVSNTSITLSYRTDQPSLGQVAYTAADGSKFTLTDSEPQTDHLFTIDQLDPKHGYSFVLSATAAGTGSDTYTVLLAPESIGVPGASLLPAVQETDSQGKVVSITSAASTTPSPTSYIAPWWAFACLFLLVVAGWIWYGVLRRRRTTPPSL